jgi:glycosyltransferase involved in cell wall biosynthesis
MINLPDPVTGESDPADRLVRRIREWMERRIVKHCSRVVFTTPGTRAIYANRFPEVPKDRWAVIPNGYDEEDFVKAERTLAPRNSADHPYVLVHSGDLYPNGRDPGPLFGAISDLRRAGKISPSHIKVVFRATAEDDYCRTLIRSLGIEDIVFILPRISHENAVVEMLEADGLLLLQGVRFNRQIPAKVYEYLRTGRPIFALSDHAGDTADLLRAEGVKSIVPLESRDAIADGLMKFLDEMRAAAAGVRPVLDRHSRKARTHELAALLDSICQSKMKQPMDLVTNVGKRAPFAVEQYVLKNNDSSR